MNEEKKDFVLPILLVLLVIIVLFFNNDKKTDYNELIANGYTLSVDGVEQNMKYLTRDDIESIIYKNGYTVEIIDSEKQILVNKIVKTPEEIEEEEKIMKVLDKLIVIAPTILFGAGFVFISIRKIFGKNPY